MKKHLVLISMSAALVLVLTGAQCSIGNFGTPKNTTTGTSPGTTSTDQNSDTTNTGSNDSDSNTTKTYSLPASYPADAPAMYPGAKIIFVTETQGNYEIHLQSSEKSVATIRKFYVDQATSKGWTPIQPEDQIQPNDQLYTNSFTKGSGLVDMKAWGVTVGKGFENTEELMTILLQVNMRELK